jgi:hypothetical protein
LITFRRFYAIVLLEAAKEKELKVTYGIGYIQKAEEEEEEEEENHHPHVDSDTNLYRYHYKRARRNIRTYGATTVHYSYKKAS